MWAKISVLAIYLSSLTWASVTFRRGRPRDGMLGLLGPPGTTRETAMKEPEDNPHLHVFWFEQRLDHFASNSATWKQKYWVNDRWYKPGGPMFLFIGGEGPTSRHWVDTNEGTPDWIKNAMKFSALAIQLEHRYYGESWPTEDASTENLRYLNSRQALADLAAFVETMKMKYGMENSKVITFGGSYPGSLSAWARLKYPHLVDGAIATSAPVWAKANFYEYLEDVQEALMAYDPKCLDAVQKGTMQIENALKTRDGVMIISHAFKLSSPLDMANEMDVANFYENLASNWQGIVQYSQDNRGTARDIMTIPNACGLMMNTDKVEWKRLVDVNDLTLNNYGMTTLDVKYTDFINAMRVHDWQHADDYRFWYWQTCTEFGYFQGSDSMKQPFGHSFNVDFFYQQCLDIFGPTYKQAYIDNLIMSTNQYYGALDLAQKNIVLPNGSIDPWHKLGLISSDNPLRPAVFIHGTAHCANMYPPLARDSAELRAARDRITQQIATWLMQ